MKEQILDAIDGESEGRALAAILFIGVMLLLVLIGIVWLWAIVWPVGAMLTLGLVVALYRYATGGDPS